MTTCISRERCAVLTKRDFVRRYHRGEFGNASPTWNGLSEWECDKGWKTGDKFHIRNRIAGGATWYNLPVIRLYEVWQEASAAVGDSNLYISAMAPTEKTLIQGEVMQSENHLALRYSTVALPMREALARQERTVEGIIGVSLLRAYLCPNSYEWLQYLLDWYPSHVVEFSTYSVFWGTLPQFNTVFWEVRLY